MPENKAPVAAVDWASRSPNIDNQVETSISSDQDLVSVSGSGYLLGVSVNSDDPGTDFRVDIDGSVLVDGDIGRMGGVETSVSTDHKAHTTLSMIHRFGSSFAVGVGSFAKGSSMSVGVAYVLD
jgi:hypothetical protein